MGFIMTTRMIILHVADTCGTLLGDAAAGDGVVGVGREISLRARSRIAYGHKIALRDHRPGDEVIKYGVSIGRVTAPVPAGDHLHVHNLSSAYDERSSRLDVETGAAGDIPYE